MKTYTNNKFTGHYPVGSAAVVLAENQEQAAERLNAALRAICLDGDAKPEDMELWPCGEIVRILVNGDY